MPSLLLKSLKGFRRRGGRPSKRVPPELYRRHYLTLPDVRFPVEAWVVDGCLVRGLYKTDYTEGGHGYVYRWVPKGEIWLDGAVDEKEYPYLLTHEYLELRLMRDRKLDYDRAHAICSKVEYRLRQGQGQGQGQGLEPLLGPRRKKPTKADLRRLTAPECFDYVVKHYVEK